ncbi:hypothetical protein [Thermoflexibacter ruber]|uniref:YD repeat-containing protein n=1 Tax=Thermoflexibacter ruber TaxID=1003 RepID=A0A1I2JSF3_9BACT|nr:hypothetical protein [Thermoflexibacter ruber]SFF57514.1 hypothetical protein SAMN04488541_10638 [Thermoflexibacter ruber]
MTKIESIHGYTITLEYQDEEYSFFDLAGEQYFLPLNPADICGASAKGVTFTSVKGKKLWRIVAEHTIVEFHANTKRQDLAANISSYSTEYYDLPADQASDITYPKAPKKLDKILIKDKLGNTQLWKEFLLEHTYFEAETQEDNVPIFNKQKFRTDKKRLKLVSLIERDYTTQRTKPPYLFEYDEKDALGQQARLPRRISLAQDRQGYYNGYFNNLTLVDFNGVCANGNSPNRNPNFQYAKIGILKSIVYPTGGKTTFSYQQHLENEYTPIGGLRIYEIRDNDGITNIEKVRRYEYLGGTLYSPLIYRYNIYFQQFILPNGQAFWEIYPTTNAQGAPAPAIQILSSNTIVPMQTTQGYHIGYAVVIVRNIGNNGNNGYTRYQYDQSYVPYPAYGSDYVKIPNDPYYDGTVTGFPEVQSQIYKGYPLRPPLHKYQRGNLLSEINYTEDNKIVSRTDYEYEGYNYLVKNMRATKVELINNNGEYLPYVHYPLYSGKSRLIKKIETIYNQNALTATGGDGVTTTTEYIYRNDPVNTKVHLQPIETRTSTSYPNEYVVSKMKYVPDYTIPAGTTDPVALGIKNLQDKHIISPVIEQYSLRQTIEANGTVSNIRVTGGSITVYKPNQPVPHEVRTLDINEAIPPTTGADAANVFKESAMSTTNMTNTFIQDGSYTTKAEFVAYDAQGNLLQHRKANDVNTVYIWGYNGTLPIAQVVNATTAHVYHTSFEDIAGSVAGGKTGKYCRQINGNAYTLPNLPAFPAVSATTNQSNGYGARYVLSFWYCNGDPTQLSDWRLFEQAYTTAPTQIPAGYQFIDEVRIFPESAMMTTYTYEPLVGVLSITDPNNTSAYYVYDEFQRLKMVKDQDGNILQKTQYHYKGQPMKGE